MKAEEIIKESNRLSKEHREVFLKHFVSFYRDQVSGLEESLIKTDWTPYPDYSKKNRQNNLDRYKKNLSTLLDEINKKC